MRSRTIAAVLISVLTAALFPASAGAQAEHSAEDRVVKNPDDGTEIAITIFKPKDASSSSPVPVVLHSHGWAGSRETEIGGLVEMLLDAGFGVVSIDQRGHGESGGQANVQDPTKETEDVKAVIDLIASLDWVRHDVNASGSPIADDPVLGAVGGSYGGGYQTMTALDEIHEEGRTRFNALAPQITWFDLPESLAPQKVVRTEWNVVLYGAGASMVPDFIHEAFAWGSVSGQWPDGTLYGEKVSGVPDLDTVFTRHSPIWYAQRGIRIDVPVLIRQGLSDNLFNLNQGLNIYERALTDSARSQSYIIGYNGGHALPSALPAGRPFDVQIGGGADACSGNFDKLTIEFFQRVFSGASTDGLLPAPYNLTTLDGECLRTESLDRTKSFAVDPVGAGATVSTVGVGAPLHIPLTEGPITVSGVPTLAGKVTSVGLDARAFFALAVGTTPADATVIQNNVMPLRVILPSQDEKFEIELPGVAADIPEGQTLFLTISPISDMSFGHGSRVPGGLVLSGLELTVPIQACGPPHDKSQGKGGLRCK